MPVDQLLKQTFSGDKQVKSGVLDLSLASTPRAPRSCSGPLSLRLTGPFESQGKGKLPKFELAAQRLAERARTSRPASRSTVDKGFVYFQGTDYVVSDNVCEPVQARATSSRSRRRSAKSGEQVVLGARHRSRATG